MQQPRVTHPLPDQKLVEKMSTEEEEEEDEFEEKLFVVVLSTNRVT